MSILKKLKLTLLATGVMFFPKGGHAADQDKDERRVILRPASSSSSSSSQAFEELRSGQSTAIADGVLLSSFLDFESGMGMVWPFYSSVNEKTMAKIRSVLEGTSSKEFQDRADAIKRNFSRSIFNTDYLPKEARAHFLEVIKVSTRALELPVSEIDARGAAINKMVESLFTFKKPTDLGFQQQHKSLLTPKGYSQFRLTDSADLIDYALALPSQQIVERADVLKKNERVLLTESQYYRPKIIKSLFQLELGEIERRATIMPSLMQCIQNDALHSHNMITNMLLVELIINASKMKIDVLEKNARLIVDRLDPFITMVNPIYRQVIRRFMLQVLTLKPEDNESHFNAIEQNWGALSTVIPLTDDRLGVILTAFKLSPDEISNRTAALIQNQDRLPPELSRAKIFREKSADEISAFAERSPEQ